MTYKKKFYGKEEENRGGKGVSSRFFLQFPAIEYIIN